MSDNEDDDLPGRLKIRLYIQKLHKLRQLILAKNVKPAVVVRKVSFEKFYDMDRDSELGKGAFAVVRKCTQKDTGKPILHNSPIPKALSAAHTWHISSILLQQEI